MAALYKFHSNGKYLKKLLRESKFHFQHPSKFNDPWDCNLPIQMFETSQDIATNFEKIFDEHKFQETFKHSPLNFTRTEILKILRGATLSPEILTAINQSFLGYFNEYYATTAITCFSKKADNLLLWAHYASQHTGVCLGYDDMILRRYFGENAFYEVMYPKSKVLPIPKLVVDPKNEVIKLLTTKSYDWRYENEVRLINYIGGECRFPKTALRTIVFGLRFDESEKKELIKVCVKKGYDLNYFDAAKIPGHFKLGFKPTNLTQLFEQ